MVQSAHVQLHVQRRAIRANFIQAKEGVGRRLTIAPNPTPSFIRVISADGHEVSDEITFSLDTPSSLDTPIGVVVTSETIEVGTSWAIPLPIALALALLIAIGGFFLFERRRSSK